MPCYLQSIIIPNALSSCDLAISQAWILCVIKVFVVGERKKEAEQERMCYAVSYYVTISISSGIRPEKTWRTIILHSNWIPHCPTVFFSSLLGIWSPNIEPPFPKFFADVFANSDLGLALESQSASLFSQVAKEGVYILANLFISVGAEFLGARTHDVVGWRNVRLLASRPC